MPLKVLFTPELHFIFSIPEFLDSERNFSMLESGCWTLDSGRWALDAGFWMLDSGR